MLAPTTAHVDVVALTRLSLSLCARTHPQDPEDPYNDKYDEEVVLLFTDQSSESADAELKALQQVH